MVGDKKPLRFNDEEALTSSELKYILDVNKKSIEINIEVEKQNEEIIENLEEFKESANEIEQKISNLIKFQEDCNRVITESNRLLKQYNELLEEYNKSLAVTLTMVKETGIDTNSIIKKEEKKTESIDKSLFRLIIILSAFGVTLIGAAIKAFVK
jgi:uncharacterized protein YjcR